MAILLAKCMTSRDFRATRAACTSAGSWWNVCFLHIPNFARLSFESPGKTPARAVCGRTNGLFTLLSIRLHAQFLLTLFGLLAKCMGRCTICALRGVQKCSCFCRNVTTQPFVFRGIDLSSGGMHDLPFTYGGLFFGGLEIFLLACGGVKI